jgi:GxxExxY protein
MSDDLTNHRGTESPSIPEDSSISYEHDPLTEQIIGAAIEVHRYLGPGLLEAVYEDCMCRELSLRNLSFLRQVPVPLIYKEVKIASPLLIDLVVENQVVVELKSMERLLAVHDAQLLTYLKLTGKKTGLLINFNTPIVTLGVKRLSL